MWTLLNRHLNPGLKRSFFLFGARGTGKSTFLRHYFRNEEVLWIDLLLPEVEDRYASRPKLLGEQIAAMVHAPQATQITVTRHSQNRNATA